MTKDVIAKRWNLPILQGRRSSKPRQEGLSVIEQTAASMGRGTWALLPTPIGAAEALSVGGDTHNMLPFCAWMPFNAIFGCVEFFGQDHNWGNVRHVRFRLAQHDFVFVGNIGTPEGHGYQHVLVHPKTGKVYWRPYNSGHMEVQLVPPSTWDTSMPNFPHLHNVAHGFAWWTGPFVGGGQDGTIFVANSTEGFISGFNPLTAEWFFDLQYEQGLPDSYQNQACYSAAKNCLVHGGHGAAPRKCWRLNADGTVTPLPDTPFEEGLGVQRYILTTDTVSGNLLALGNPIPRARPDLWELDPFGDGGKGLWTQLLGSRVPPDEVGNPVDAGTSSAWSVAWTPIDALGVNLVTTCKGGALPTMCLYKH